MISSYLTQENYVVQKYTPYGPFEKLMPYLGRRAQEMSDMVREEQTRATVQAIVEAQSWLQFVLTAHQCRSESHGQS
mgnify:CR=1 FL=1